jgi:hypothetical protein
MKNDHLPRQALDTQTKDFLRKRAFPQAACEADERCMAWTTIGAGNAFSGAIFS